MRREIGRGSIGVVALGRWRETDVAIKILEGPPDETVRDKRREVDPALRRAMEKEVSSPTSVHHYQFSHRGIFLCGALSILSYAPPPTCVMAGSAGGPLLIPKRWCSVSR